MSLRIEVLVHAGAAASRKEDNNYIAQAAAYADFVGRTVVSPQSQDHQYSHHRLSTSALPDVKVQHIDADVVATNEVIFVDHTQLAFTALDSQLVTSSLGFRPSRPTSALVQQCLDAQDSILYADANEHFLNNHTTSQSSSAAERASQYRKTGPSPAQHQSQDTVENNTTPARRANQHGTGYETDAAFSVASSSSYLKTPLLDRSNKKHRLDDSTKYCPISTIACAQRGVATPHAAAEEAPATNLQVAFEELQAGRKPIVPAAESCQSDRSGSELPTSYSLSDITSQSSRAQARRDALQRSVSDPGPSVGSHALLDDRAAAKTSRNARAKLQQSQEISSQPLKHPAAHAGAVANTTVVRSELTPRNTTGNIQSPSGTTRPVVTHPIVACDGTAIEPNPSTYARSSIRSLSTSIRAPEPTVGQGGFTSHITDALKYLAEISEAKDSYQPVLMARPLRSLERGYWLIECSSWEPQPQIDFWLFLEKTVGNGNAGWGIWCTRAETEKKAGHDAHAMASLGVVKVFCWGEVVKHIYLLLYVASKSRVRKLGLQWIDAEEKLVVQMRSRP